MTQRHLALSRASRPRGGQGLVARQALGSRPGWGGPQRTDPSTAAPAGPRNHRPESQPRGGGAGGPRQVGSPWLVTGPRVNTSASRAPGKAAGPAPRRPAGEAKLTATLARPGLKATDKSTGCGSGGAPGLQAAPSQLSAAVTKRLRPATEQEERFTLAHRLPGFGPRPGLRALGPGRGGTRRDEAGRGGGAGQHGHPPPEGTPTPAAQQETDRKGGARHPLTATPPVTSLPAARPRLLKAPPPQSPGLRPAFSGRPLGGACPHHGEACGRGGRTDSRPTRPTAAESRASHG